MPEFDVIKYMDGEKKQSKSDEGYSDEYRLMKFFDLCQKVKNKVDEIEEKELVKDKSLERQIKALLGEPAEAGYYKNKINQILDDMQPSNTWYPVWYSSAAEAIFAESYGFSGITNWMNGEEGLSFSTSCKIIGENIFYDINGVLELQPQTMPAARREQLRSTLLLSDPTKDRSRAYHEIYSTDGKRITIYTEEGMTKEGQDTIVFRRYLEDVSTFEDIARRGTIPLEAIPLFESMILCGFNTLYTGPPKAGKSTLMTASQRCEDPRLEGLCIETDPEIPMHLIMPKAPIMQLVPKDSYMDEVMSTAKRSDAQYVFLGEARTGKILDIFLEAANMGNRHSKGTMHNSETIDISYDIAQKITRDCGGDLKCTMIKAAKSVHYVFNMFSLPSDRKQKRLKGIWEMRFDSESMRITMHQICKYRVLTDDWVWAYTIGEDKKEIGIEENWEAFKQFDKLLKELAENYPNKDKYEFEPAYLKFWRG